MALAYAPETEMIEPSGVNAPFGMRSSQSSPAAVRAQVDEVDVARKHRGVEAGLDVVQPTQQRRTVVRVRKRLTRDVRKAEHHLCVRAGGLTRGLALARVVDEVVAGAGALRATACARDAVVRLARVDGLRLLEARQRPLDVAEPMIFFVTASLAIQTLLSFGRQSALVSSPDPARGALQP